VDILHLFTHEPVVEGNISLCSRLVSKFILRAPRLAKKYSLSIAEKINLLVRSNSILGFKQQTPHQKVTQFQAKNDRTKRTPAPVSASQDFAKQKLNVLKFSEE